MGEIAIPAEKRTGKKDRSEPKKQNKGNRTRVPKQLLDYASFVMFFFSSSMLLPFILPRSHTRNLSVMPYFVLKSFHETKNSREMLHVFIRSFFSLSLSLPLCLFHEEW